MSTKRVLKSLTFQPGVTLQVKVDDAEAEDSINRYAAEVHCIEGNDVEFFVPPHWHKNHTEIMTIIEGRIEITLNGKKMIGKAGDAPILIPPKAVHSMKGFKGEKLVMQEQAIPAGRYKAAFFNDLLQEGKFGGLALSLRVFRDHDTYLALPFYFRFIDELFIMIFGNIASFFAPGKPKDF
jgi:mannose-6-phosphate isomerase-like protein (cupin superfamily)